MANQEIKETLKKCNLRQWQLAELMGISEFTLIRKLRKELPEADKKKIIDLIKEKSA